MAAGVSKKEICAICPPKQILAITSCKGCLKYLCRKHFNEHRDKLSTDLHNVLDCYNNLLEEFRVKIDSESKPPENDDVGGILKEIDEWEKTIIKRVSQAANDARTNLRCSYNITNHYDQLKQRADKLCAELREQEESESFVESDIDDWLKQLEAIKIDLNRPSTVTTNLPVLQMKNIDWNDTIKISFPSEMNKKEENVKMLPQDKKVKKVEVAPLDEEEEEEEVQVLSLEEEEKMEALLQDELKKVLEELLEQLLTLLPGKLKQQALKKKVATKKELKKQLKRVLDNLKKVKELKLLTLLVAVKKEVLALLNALKEKLQEKELYEALKEAVKMCLLSDWEAEPLLTLLWKLLGLLELKEVRVLLKALKEKLPKKELKEMLEKSKSKGWKRGPKSLAPVWKLLGLLEMKELSTLLKALKDKLLDKELKEALDIWLLPKWDFESLQALIWKLLKQLVGLVKLKELSALRKALKKKLLETGLKRELDEMLKQWLVDAEVLPMNRWPATIRWLSRKKGTIKSKWNSLGSSESESESESESKLKSAPELESNSDSD